MKFKRGQLVRKRSEGNSLAFVIDAEYPNMLVYYIDTANQNEIGKIIEVKQSDFVRA